MTLFSVTKSTTLFHIDKLKSRFFSLSLSPEKQIAIKLQHIEMPGDSKRIIELYNNKKAIR